MVPASIWNLLLCPLALSLISLLAAMVTPPARLVISTPAGASRDRVEVADSRDKEEPAGDLTDLVAREPSRLTPPSPVRTSFSDPRTVSALLVWNKIFLSGENTENCEAAMVRPDLSSCRSE